MSDVSIEDYCEMVEEYQARIAKLETALKALVNDAENYVNASEEYISDSNFDESGWLAESHANLRVVSIPKARKALEE